MTGDHAIVVLAKEPRPGHVKTRLTPPCSPVEAAALAAAALADTLAVVAGTPARRRVLALDGCRGPWLPAGFEVLPQSQGSLDIRIADVLAAVPGPLLLIGMDTPQVSAELLGCDFEEYPAWLGAAADGGFWALGLADPDPALVRGVPMSVPHTYTCQRRRLEEAGLATGQLSVLRDVDTWADAEAVAGLAPRGRFGTAMSGLRPRLPAGTVA